MRISRNSRNLRHSKVRRIPIIEPHAEQPKAPIISREDSPCIVRVKRTDEDLTIARHANHVISEKSEEQKQDP